MDLANEKFLEEVKYIQNRSVHDEEVIGCFLCNYGDHRLCGAFQSSGCKNGSRCKGLNKVYNERMRS